MTTGKTIALTRGTIVGKVMSLFFFLICCLGYKWSKCLLISWLQSSFAVILDRVLYIYIYIFGYYEVAGIIFVTHVIYIDRSHKDKTSYSMLGWKLRNTEESCLMRQSLRRL